MKKLRIALTLLFALSCSLFLFACKSDKYIADIEFSGQKELFKENEEFSVGDLKVSVYYQDKDEPVVLEAGEYTVDSSAYDKTNPGTYAIKITPNDQTVNENSEPASKTYNVTVDHDWKENADGSITCACGAKQLTYDGLAEKFVFGDWAVGGTLTRGEKTYPEIKTPAPGELHYSLGTLVSGQKLTVTLEMGPNDAEGWDTPLMGVRDGGVGVLPRHDAWVILGGPNGAFNAPEGVTTAPITGSATADSTPFAIYRQGDSWGDSVLKPAADGTAAICEITFDYQEGVFQIITNVTAADGSKKSRIDSFAVPASGYEIVAYGEQVTYTITKAVYVENRAVETFTATAPTKKAQVEGKTFDKTGSTTLAKFTKGSDLTNVGNYYAYLDVTKGEETTTTKVNLASNPLVAGMYDFSVEFGGKTVYLTDNGNSTKAAENPGKDLVKVVPAYINGAENMTEAYLDAASDLTFDYDVKGENGIQLLVTGAATKIPAGYTGDEFGTGATYGIAFTIVGFKPFDLATSASIENANVKVKKVKAENGLNNVQVFVGLKAAVASFDIKLQKSGDTTTDLQTVTVDLSKVTVAQKVTVQVSTNFTLDAGGDYTVVYKSDTAMADTYQLITGSRRPTVKDVRDAGNAGFTVNNNLKIKSAQFTDDNKTLTVVYWRAAPDLGNVSTTNSLQMVSLTDGTSTVASVPLYYSFEMSQTLAADSGYAKIDDYLYAKIKDDKLYVFAAADIDETASVSSTLELPTTMLNIQNAKGSVYNVAVKVNADGTASVLDDNVLTQAANAKLVTFGKVDYSADYDRAVLLLIEIDLPKAANLRATDKAEVFYFTVEDALSEQGADSYTIYTVTGNAIASAEKTATAAGDLYTVQEGNCVLNEVKAYRIDTTPTVTDAAKKVYFYYGARITAPARGYHEWKATADANVMKCDECGYTRTRTDNGLYIIVPEEGTAIENTDTGTEWFDGVVGTKKVTGDFAVQYTWQNIRDNNYTDVVVQIFDGSAKYFNATILETNANVAEEVAPTQLNVGWGDLNKGTTVKAYSNGALFYDSTKTTGNDLTKALNIGDSKNLFRGNYTMTYIRLGSTLYVVVNFKQTGKEGTLSQTKIEADETVKLNYTVVYTMTGFTTEDVTVEVAGNPYFVDNFTVRTGSAEENFGVVKGPDNKNYEIAFGGYTSVIAPDNEKADANAWWSYGGTGAVVGSGNFAYKFTWTVKDVNYIADFAVEFHTNDTEPSWFGMRTFLCDYNPQPGVNKLFSEGYTITHTGTIDGKAATPGEGIPVGIPLAGWTDCVASVTIYRIGTTLTIIQEVANEEIGAAKVVTTITNFTTDDITVQANGNLHNNWVQNIARSTGTVSEVK